MVETVTIQSENKGETLEQTAARLDAEAAASGKDPLLAGEKAPEERPSWLPEKFKSVEDMAKAYSELEKAQGKAKAAPEDAEAPTGEQAAEAVKSANLDMQALEAEYATNGELSADSLKALEAVGITPEMVNLYIAGQEAQAQALVADMLEPVNGNMEAYNEMISWASNELSDTEIDNFNTVLDSGNQAAIKMAVQNLANKYAESNGSEPGRTVSGKSSTSGSSVYESTADLMKDMQNPEYHKNPAFRAKVADKLGRSNIL